MPVPGIWCCDVSLSSWDVCFVCCSLCCLISLFVCAVGSALWCITSFHICGKKCRGCAARIRCWEVTNVDSLKLKVRNILYEALIVALSGDSCGMDRVLSCICKFVCLYLCSKRKMAWAIITKFGRDMDHGRASACIDPEVKRSKGLDCG